MRVMDDRVELELPRVSHPVEDRVGLSDPRPPFLRRLPFVRNEPCIKGEEPFIEEPEALV